MSLLTQTSSSWSSSPATDLLRPLRLAVGVWEEGGNEGLVEEEMGREGEGGGGGGGDALYGCVLRSG